MRHNTKFLFCFLIFGLLLSLSYAQETAEKPTKIDIISDKAKESTVRLVGFSKRGSELGIGGGTGFFVAPDKIATNFHVAAGVSGPIFAKLSHKETIWPVEGVVAFDVAYDIAILKVTGEGTPLPLTDSDILQIGEPVLLVGFPSPDRSYKVTEGVVEKIRDSDKRFHATAESYSGNSGSPVLNSKGEVIGIHYGHDPGNSPVNAIKALLAGATSMEPLDQWQKRNDIRAYVCFEQGKRKYYDSDAEGALENFNKAIELTPNDPEIYKFRAKSKVSLEDYQAAIENYNQAIKLNPDDASAYKERAEAKRKLGNHTSAIADYNQVIKLNPDDASAYKERAETKRKLGNHTSAIADYNQAIKLNPKDAFTYRARADAKHKNGDYTGAIEDYNQTITLNPKDAEAYKKRGKVKAELGDDPEAIEDYNQALKLNPKNVFTYNNRAFIKYKLGDYAGAIEDYNQAIKKLKDGSFTYQTYAEHSVTTVTITPSDSYTYYVYNNRGWAKRKQGDHTGAMEDFTHAIELKPDDAYGYKNRAGVKRELRDYDGAIEDYIQAIKLKPDDADAYLGRGMAKVGFDDHLAAIEDFTTVIKLKPDNPTAYHLRGHSKQDLGQEEAAQIDFEKAKELETGQ